MKKEVICPQHSLHQITCHCSCTHQDPCGGSRFSIMSGGSGGGGSAGGGGGGPAAAGNNINNSRSSGTSRSTSFPLFLSSACPLPSLCLTLHGTAAPVRDGHSPPACNHWLPENERESAPFTLILSSFLLPPFLPLFSPFLRHFNHSNGWQR